MQQVALDELARAVGADMKGGGLPRTVDAVGTDTRALPLHCLFVALRGDNFDGHKFVRDALAGGAVAAMVDSTFDATGIDAPLLVVDDTLAGLGAIAHHVRKTLQRPVIAITGSNGKTTTKELTAAALSVKGDVHKTSGNFNNLVGLPLTVFDWPREAWCAVLEMGMNHAGEIAKLTKIATPNVGVITNIGPAHLGCFDSVEDIAHAKGELYAELPADAVAVVNVDDPLVQKIARPKLQSQPQITFGRANDAQVRVVDATEGARGVRVKLEVHGATLELQLGLHGVHNGHNAAAAIAAALALECPVEEAAQALERAKVPGGRMRTLKGRGGCHLMDDTYNANPDSMRAAFSTLRSLTQGRAIAVVGDMYELGEHAPALHREVGRAAADCGIEVVWSVGEFAQDVAAGAKEGGARERGFATVDDVVVELSSFVQDGDWVLVKGSRGMRMERIIEALQEEAA